MTYISLRAMGELQSILRQEQEIVSKSPPANIIGRATFSESMEECVLPFNKQALTESEWQISRKTFPFSNQINVVVFSKMVRSQAELIRVLDHLGNGNPHILKSIAHISFSKLRKLYLGDNFIESIEFVCKLKCPQLQHLELENNKITHLRPLRKVSRNVIKDLHLRSNLFIELTGIRQCWLQKIKELWLENPYSSCICECIVHEAAALQAKTIGDFRIGVYQRITESRANEMLCKKFNINKLRVSFWLLEWIMQL